MAITIYKRNDLDISFNISDQDNNPIDLTLAEVLLVVKTSPGSTRRVIEKSSKVDGEIEIDSTNTSKCTIYLTPEDTESLTEKTYIYEVLIILDGGKRYTAVVDDLEVKETVIDLN